MATVTARYLGGLRTETTHIKSGDTIVTDAPTDNHGKGEAFSPTDLIAASLLTCMITVMDIAAQARGWDLGEIDGETTKVMIPNPRRVGELHTKITFRNNQLDAKQREAIERVAIDCPVAKSMHPEIVQETVFVYA